MAAARMDARLRNEAGTKTSAPIAVPVVVILAGCLSGCLYTTHHFNTGRVLEPGKTAVTLGMGRATFYDEICPKGYFRTTSEKGDQVCADELTYSDTVPQVLEKILTPKISLGYRLGVRGAWGPFQGLELGWQMEAPTNPGTVDFDLKFGLPAPGGMRLDHSLSAGWEVGMWADNSYFLEYAASRPFGANALYANYRFTWLATQQGDLERSFEEWKFVSKRRYANQFSFGFDWKIRKIFLIPDFISPQIFILFPVYPGLNQVDTDLLDAFLMDFNLGFGWNF